MASNSEEPSYVVQMLEDLRSGSQRRVSRLHACSYSEPADSLKRKSTDDDSNDSLKLPKLDITPKSTSDSLERNSRCPSPAASPWETYRIRGQLLDANIKITDLENQISRHHSLRHEMEKLFEKERDSLQKQVDREKSMVKELESHLQLVRKREVEIKEELKQCKTALNRDKMNFDERIQSLQGENAKLSENLQELEQTSQDERSTTSRLIEHLKEDLTEKEQQLEDLRNRNLELEQKLQEALLFQTQFEQLSQELQNSQIKIKELEKGKEDYLEAAEIVKTKHEKLFRYSEIEKEVTVLREENNNLKRAVPKHLLLEEMVEDLKTRQALSEEQAHDLAWSQNRLSQLQTMLDDWHKVAQDYCEGYMSSSHPPDPAIIRKRINELQQRVHVLTADLSETKSQLSDTQQRKDRLTIDLQTIKKEKEKCQSLNEELNNRLRLLQKKHQLVSAERNSYRSQLDSYEKDLTISSSSLASQQNQQLQQRLETSERILDGYRKMLEKMESEADKTKGFVGNSDFVDKLNRLESERNTLLQEKEKLQKRKDELEMQLEYRAIKGDFNPVTSKVLHFRMNPASEAEAQYEDEVTKLRSKCSRLEERIKLLEEGNIQDITQKVEENVASSKSQEVQGLQEIINAQEIKMQRLKEVFHASAKEFREVCYELFGYKIDRNENLYKLSSMYAECADDHLMFKRMPDGTIDMMETPYSATLGDLIELHLLQHKSPPLFLGAVTVELFNRQSLSHTNFSSV